MDGDHRSTNKLLAGLLPTCRPLSTVLSRNLRPSRRQLDHSRCTRAHGSRVLLQGHQLLRGEAEPRTLPTPTAIPRIVNVRPCREPQATFRTTNQLSTMTRPSLLTTPSATLIPVKVKVHSPVRAHMTHTIITSSSNNRTNHNIPPSSNALPTLLPTRSTTSSITTLLSWACPRTASL